MGHGLHEYRFKDNPEEEAFAKAWERENTRPMKRGILDWLLGDGVEPVDPSPRDKVVAAVVIQWLGSPVGQAFLRDLGWSKE